jgi:signal peptidase
MTFVTKQISPASGAHVDSAHGKSAWRRFTAAAGTVAAVLVAVLAGLMVVTAVATHLSAQGQYTAFGHPVMSVLSGSMTPAIRTGDLIVDDEVTAQQARTLRIGQIASFRETPGSKVIITHRIVGEKVIRGVVSYATKGDANNSPDTILRPSSNVVGVFAYTIRKGGYILNALHHPIVPVMLIVSVLLWLAAGLFCKRNSI